MMKPTAKMDTVFYDHTPAYENEDCDIRIHEKDISVSYNDHGMVIYRGKDEGHGHFILECPERNGKASLHQIQHCKFLEGFWIEDGKKGFWRITLS